MAYLDSVIFQRTDSGLAEIRGMKLELKKSERLLLVTVDGASNYRQLQSLLKGMAQERLDRALFSLQAKELICEVLYPLDPAKLDLIDPAIVQLFLRGTVVEQSHDTAFLAGDAREVVDDEADAPAELPHAYPGSHLGMPLSSVISSNSSEGLSVNTRKDRMAPLLDLDSPSTIGLDLSELVDGLEEKRKSRKTKIVQAFPQPERRKRRRKSGSKRVVKDSWHIYAYYTIFALAVLLVLLSLLAKLWR